MRRLPMAGALMVVLGLAALLGPAGAGASAGRSAAISSVSAPADSGSSAVVVEVDGLLDPVLVDLLERTIDEAGREPGMVGVVLQLNSQGAAVTDEQFGGLVNAMRESRVPVSVWIGPSGARARGASAVLAGHAASLGIAPGSSWGLGDTTIDPALLEGTLREVPVRPLSAGEAADLGLVSFDAPTLGDFMVNLPGFESNEVTQGEEVRREPVTRVVLTSLSIGEQFLHTVASPAVAYLLFSVGLALLVFELFTAGVGVAGLVGAGSFALGCFGLDTLPARSWAVGLLVLSMVAMAVDVQTGVPRVWTGIGLVAYVAGSLFLYEGFALSWITLLVAFASVGIAFLGGMPSMVRTRFSTPTIGREWMIGERGRAVTAVNPDGVVQVREALWRAFTNAATPIDELDQVQVVGIDGLVLEVEPVLGAASDPGPTR